MKVSLSLARALRKDMSKPEIYLWDALRRRVLGGLKFRQQHPIGPYVLDFYCVQATLAVEVDGLDHGLGDKPARDARRDAWLAMHGVETIRIPAKGVFANLDGVYSTIMLAAQSRLSSSPSGGSDSPSGER